ncbi:MAG: hypothetical protein HPY54_10670 [Chthonomonadetes bacterium]|nr:hypothetical protein [Chthonomonadetes bacterium]
MHLPEMALEEALSHGECALCWLAHRNLLRRTETLLREHLADPEWRASLRQGSGFCSYHADWMLRHGEVLPLAILAEDVLAHVEQWFSTKRHAPQRCQLCEAQGQDMAQFAHLLARLLDDAEWRGRYEQSAGLCVPHLQMVARVCRRETKGWLIECERARWQALRLQLQEVIQKHDYRFKDVPWGEETGSWRRAFHKLYGTALPEEASDER